MNKITINNQEFEETNVSIPMTDWTWYKNKWYKPVEQFKVGDWIMECWDTSPYYNKTPFKITKITNNCIRYSRQHFNEDSKIENENDLRKATSQEILEHLRAVAKEKGLVKGARVRKINEIDKGVFVTIVQEDDDYYPETDEYAKSGIILYSNGKWAEKIEEVKDYEILSFIDSSNNNIFDEMDNSQTFTKYFSKKTKTYVTLSSLDLSIPSFNIHSVKCLKTGNVYTVGDKVIAKNNVVFTIDRFEIDNTFNQGIGVWSKSVIIGDHQNVCLSWIDKYVPKFTFGGHEVKCELFNGTRVKVVCKGEVGYHTEIEEILKNYFRPCKFGNVQVKSFKLSEDIQYLDGKIDVINPKFDINNVQEVTIGCLTGTYKELNDIYRHCLTILK